MATIGDRGAGEVSGATKLRILAEHLRTVNPGRFHMGGWCTCAAGHACNNSVLTALGLEKGQYGSAPRFGELRGIAALAKFFEIRTQDAMYLFASMDYNRRGQTIGYREDLFQSRMSGTPAIRATIERIDVVLKAQEARRAKRKAAVA